MPTILSPKRTLKKYKQIMPTYPKRKTVRLQTHDYNQAGAYFITVCTKGKVPFLTLSTGNDENATVGTDVLGGPPSFPSTQFPLSKKGLVVFQNVQRLQNFYPHIKIEYFVIMPNHVHLLLGVYANSLPQRTAEDVGPYEGNEPIKAKENTKLSVVSTFLSTFKRFCNREIGENIWQSRSYDHVIRNAQDFSEHVRYIFHNPLRWKEDNFYV